MELDALPPDELRTLYQEALDSYWDMTPYDAVKGREATERAWLRQQADDYGDDQDDEGGEDDD